MKIAILYDGGSQEWSEADVASVMANVQEVRGSLRRLGHSTSLVPVMLHDVKWLARLQRVDAVFNLCEGINGVAKYEDWAVGALELTGVPFTGCRSSTVTLCHRKHVANTLLERAGVPVPAFALARRNEIPVHLKLPVIVKPSAEDASVGIDNAAVCATRKALASRLARSSEQYAEVLVQEYVPGREINVGFLGAEVLPLSEISFAKMPESHWPIVSYAAKWQNDSPEYIGTEPVCPAPLDATLERRVVDVARRAWQLLGGEGYGRVDMRIAPDGSPYVLEVNPNPDLSIDAGFARMAEVNGWDYDAMVGQILDEALSRAGHGLAATQLVRQISA